MAGSLVTCMAIAAWLTGLPPDVLPAIHAVEGGKVGMATPNKDAAGRVVSEDLGVMQINSVAWLPALSAAMGTSRAEMRHSLVDDECFNVLAAGLIVKVYLAETHGDMEAAIGDYHSHTPIKRAEYQLKIARAAMANAKGAAPRS